MSQVEITTDQETGADNDGFDLDFGVFSREMTGHLARKGRVNPTNKDVAYVFRKLGFQVTRHQILKLQPANA